MAPALGLKGPRTRPFRGPFVIYPPENRAWSRFLVRKNPIMNRIDAHGLKIAPVLFDFIAREATPKTGISPDAFWAGLAAIIRDLAPRNRELLAVRDALQAKIDGWHRAHKGKPFDMNAYTAFLKEIGYLLPEPATPEGRDRQCRRRDRQDLRTAAGRAAHQRALRPERRQRALGQSLRCILRHRCDPARGRAKAARGSTRRAATRWSRKRRPFSIPAVPLATGSHTDVTSYSVIAGQLAVKLKSGNATALKSNAQFAGYRGEPAAPTAILLVNNGMHIEIKIDRGHIDRQGRSGRRRRHDPGIGGLYHPRHGRQRRGGRCRGQGAGLPQHARPDGRHAVRRLREGRQDAQARAQPRPRLQDAGRQGTQTAWPQPALDAQCRPSHVHRRRARRQRRGNSGRPSRRRGRRSARDPRSQGQLENRATAAPARSIS